MNRGRKRFIHQSFFVILIFALVMPVQLALADDIQETQGFRKQVTLAGIREHQAAFQRFSDENGGNRVVGSPGYDASARRVWQKLPHPSPAARTMVPSLPLGSRQVVSLPARKA